VKNKYKILLGIVIIIIAISTFTFRENITGYFVNDAEGFEPVDFSDIPETEDEILYSPVQAVETTPGSKEYALVQKYRVGENENCVRDCISHCVQQDGLEYYKAYVQSYGNCMCKCVPTN
jgi:hypothetical protein